MTAPPGTILADVEARPLRWLWPGWIPLGKITVLDGDPGLGKSTLTLDLAARISTGKPMPDGAAGLSGGVVLASAEDDLADTIRPRLDAAGADCSRIVALSITEFASIVQLDALRDAIKRVDAALVIVDPLMAYLGSSATTNSFRDQDVRALLAPLAKLAAECEVAVLLVRHLNKSSETANPLYRGGGSIGIIGAARAGLLAARDPNDPERRVLAMTKANLAREASSLSYRTLERSGGAVGIEWLGASAHGAAKLLTTPENADAKSALDDAAEWLRAELANGPKAQAAIMASARAAGFRERTIRRAKGMLGAKSSKSEYDGGWAWRLPEDGQAPIIPADLATLDATTTKHTTSPNMANGHLGWPPSDGLATLAGSVTLEDGQAKMANGHLGVCGANTGLSSEDGQQGQDKASLAILAALPTSAESAIPLDCLATDPAVLRLRLGGGGVRRVLRGLERAQAVRRTRTAVPRFYRAAGGAA